nr:MAG TPA: hypothetical protein [Caudoviricetes sp.]
MISILNHINHRFTRSLYLFLILILLRLIIVLSKYTYQVRRKLRCIFKSSSVVLWYHIKLSAIWAFSANFATKCRVFRVDNISKLILVR